MFAPVQLVDAAAGLLLDFEAEAGLLQPAGPLPDGIRLPQEVLDRIEPIAAMVPYRPFEEPFGLPFGRDYRGPEQA